MLLLDVCRWLTKRRTARAEFGVDWIAGQIPREAFTDWS